MEGAGRSCRKISEETVAILQVRKEADLGKDVKWRGRDGCT